MRTWLKPLLVALLSLCVWAEPANLTPLKHQIKEYFSSGNWEREQREVTDKCRVYLEQRLASCPSRPALVLDVDETALTAWTEELALDFGYLPEHWVEWEKGADAPAIKPVLELYRYAREHDIAIFFVTGRKESSRPWTEKNLRSVGYADFARVYLKPPTYLERSVVGMKMAARQDILAQGYQILANVGDQQSDLEGGYADATFKLPNPIYILP